MAQFGELQMEGLETTQICYFTTNIISFVEVAVPKSQMAAGERPLEASGKNVCFCLSQPFLATCYLGPQATTLHLQRHCWVQPV